MKDWRQADEYARMFLWCWVCPLDWAKFFSVLLISFCFSSIHYPVSPYKTAIPLRLVIVLKEMGFLYLMPISREIKISEFSSKSSGIKSISFFNYTKTCLLICSQNGLSAGKLPEACGVISLAFYGSQQWSFLMASDPSDI